MISVNKPFTITNGKLVEIQPVHFENNGTQLDCSHSIVYNCGSTHKLLIDSIDGTVDLLPNNLYREVFVDKDPESPYFGYYSKKGNKTKEKVWQEIQSDIQKRVKTAAIILCPTYRCNCKCIYCYQQNGKLDYVPMSKETLSKSLDFASETFAKTDAQFKNIQLFGGEPFLPENEETIKTTLEFCRKEKVPIIFTTNLVQMRQYRRLLYVYHGYISRICTTVDGSKEIHNSRRVSLVTDDPFSEIIDNINYLLEIGIRVNIAINLDRESVGHLKEYLSLAEEQGWSGNSLVTLEIGRVDDRFYEGCADNVLSESELLDKLIQFDREKPFPSNIKLAFLKAIQPLAELIGVAFNQKEWGRSRYFYCWADTPADEIYYIDSSEDIYRCTYTVGKHTCRIGTLECPPESPELVYGAIPLLSEKCWNCNIGGLCLGGCINSRKKDSERVCREEKDNLDYFVNRILTPWVKHELCNAELKHN